MDIIKLTDAKLSVDEIMQKVTDPSCGAISLFVGTTRDNFEEKKVLTLEYDSYKPMAEKILKQICGEMREKWENLVHIAIYHRLGTVAVTEASIVIAISSPHRSDALEATQFCIETVKQKAPIWKKEIYEGDEGQWKENKECSWASSSTAKNNKTNVIFKPRIEIPKVSSHLIQINSSNEEIQRRIKTFMNRKREQANMTNIKDFCGIRNTEETCARIDAVLNRHKNSKSHLKMQKVYNTYGPYAVRKKQTFISSAVEERVESLEKCLVVQKPVSKDIYERLKKLEDRILFLESVSPEYTNFWKKDVINEIHDSSKNEETVKKRKFEISDVNNLLQDLEKKSGIKNTAV